jgi:hypothetical protein
VAAERAARREQERPAEPVDGASVRPAKEKRPHRHIEAVEVPVVEQAAGQRSHEDPRHPGQEDERDQRLLPRLRRSRRVLHRRKNRLRALEDRERP